jgi:hypothetical protein
MRPERTNRRRAESVALAAAVADARADSRVISHEDMQAWLLRLAVGEFDAIPPEPHPA